MSKTTNFMLFIFGAAIGSVATWTYAKKKYERIAQEEIDSVKEVFAKRGKTETEKTEQVAQDDEPNINDYAKVLDENSYADYTESKDKFTPPDDKDREYFVQAYVISPDEFGENDDYERISLTYYADKILADDNDDIIEDIEATVSFEALSHFGEYEDDSVFVRNDIRKCDYEILLDQRNYPDVVKTKPHSTEV